MLLTLLGLSLVGGFCSGLLGVGGAVVLIPLLLSVPPLLGVGQLTMHEVSGLTMVQVLASSLTGCLAHRRQGYAHMPTILAVGIPMALFSFFGAALSKSLSDHIMVIIFGCLVAIAFMMLIKKAPAENTDTTEFDFNKLLSSLCGASVGFVAGVIGAGGGFILIPVMIRILKIPIRVAVGSSLGIVFVGALMGALGKMLTLQVQWLYLVPIIVGSLPSSLLGAHVSKKLPSHRIRHILLFLVLLILVKTWYDISLIVFTHIAK